MKEMIPEIRLADYWYTLPENRIAQEPLRERDSSKLLEWEKERAKDVLFRQLPDCLEEPHHVFFNDTKVVNARLLFQTPTGASIELFCLEPETKDAPAALAWQQQENVLWRCLVGNKKRWKTDTTLVLQEGNLQLEARWISDAEGYSVIAFEWDTAQTFAEVLACFGHVPLPPYMKRSDELADRERYQTVYAASGASVAAPTAGLHFSETVLSALVQGGHTLEYLTLHVGAGTFMPVKAEFLSGHTMHREEIEIKKDTLLSLLSSPAKPVLAVGTTSMRTLESIYHLGKVLQRFPGWSASDGIDQWVGFGKVGEIEKAQALENVLKWMESRDITSLHTATRILIAPGYTFKIVDRLLTNFHQPGSTLILLVAAFIGEDWRKVYEHALNFDYRFLSYGDACLFRKK
jgi:S-adenosylmethionine:tRNA ribosyltransferase-isomerase